ncbi:MAG TPA: fosfomycin resistance glutathione transferase [Edaphobacter sp.]|nr:fosfomycin resistance glutathione transferase [Edaphobacter sp.]
MISGINHITLAVRDLESSFAFYKDVLGLRPVAKWYKGAYFEAGHDWICLNLDADTRTECLPEYTHIAFTVSTENFAAAVEHLRAAGAQQWQENRSPGESFYFLDPNGHKLEIHDSNLSARMQALKTNPPKDLIFF